MNQLLSFKNLIILGICCICVGFMGFSLGVNHFLIPSGELKIAVVDGTRLKKEARSFQVVHNILLSEQSKAYEEISPAEAQLLKEQEEIRLEEKTNPENAHKRNEIFEKRVFELEQKMQKKRLLLEKQRDYLSEMIQKTVFAIIDEISIKESISIVLNKTIEEKSSVFYVEKRMDLTDKIISELDKRLKDIKLPKITE